MIFLWHSQSFLQSIRIWDFPGGAVVTVPSLVQEDPTHRGATKPVCHNY